MSFLNKLKSQFAGQEDTEQNPKIVRQEGLLQMVRDNRSHAPIIDKGIDIRGIIDEAPPLGLSPHHSR